MKTTEQEKKFMSGLIDEFKAFVIDAMGNEVHADFADHNDFLKVCLETFIDLKGE